MRRTFYLIMITLLFMLLFVVTLKAEDPIITLPNGQIKGKLFKTRAGVEFYSYTEIPYAQPPIGKLRFQAPQPSENWTGILDCTKSTKYCFNANDISEAQTEDCLILNVYTPVAPGENNTLPVMYHIYGGGFVGGSTVFNNYGPHYFMEYGVIIVSVSYRVGPFGFLSTGDKTIPGNYGLKDQSLGLKWVQQNIYLFGGDPEKVTVFGESAGGASTTYQIISKKSAGLFRAAIAESGSALNPWAFQRFHKNIAFQLGRNIDPSFNESRTSEELLELLQSKSAVEINQAAYNLQMNYFDQMTQGFFYAPTIEPEHDEAFITEPMFVSLDNGNINKIPLIIGINSQEDFYRLDRGWKPVAETMKLYDNDPHYITPLDLHITNDTVNHQLGLEIKRWFVDGDFQNDPCGTINYFSDMGFNRPIIKYAELQSKYTNVYFYEFDYHGDLPGKTIPISDCGKCTHCEDSNYIWTYGGDDHLLDYPEDDIQTSRRYMTMLTNFVKHLNPIPDKIDLLQNITWPTVSPTKFMYLHIDDELTIRVNPKNVTFSKWVEFYDKNGVKPFDTF